MFRNEAAERLVSRGAVYVEGGRLRLRGKHEDAAFAAASTSSMVSAECSPESHPARSRQRLVRCHEGFDGSALIHLVAIPLAQAMGAFGASAVTIATVFQARQCVRVDPFAVSQAYGLTPAEARVAVGVAENKTIKTLARQYHVEISTLRTQLHCVFEKIGVQRQSELAQVLSSNPVLWGGGVLENGHA
jgi:DNA-binding CsgD family transcriptional regulator